MGEKISSDRQAYLRAIRHKKYLVWIARAVLLVSFFALWELAARMEWIDPFILSSPSRVWKTLVELTVSGELWRHVGTSCLETAVGFLLGTMAGALIAVALWLSPTFYRILDPYLVVLNSLPKTALGPVFIVWMGAGPGAIIAMTLAISLVVTVLEIHNGFCSTDPGIIRLMQSFGATRGQTLVKAVIPANFTTMMSALKVNVGLSWVGVIMGEFLVSRAGLGYLIVYGSQVFKMDLVMATVLLLAVAAAGMYQCILLLEKVLKKHLGVST